MRTAIRAPVEHPGTFLAEELSERGWTQVDLAYILGISPPQLSPILTGKQGISPDMARALGEAMGMPADFFANLQKMYDLQHAKQPDPGVKTRSTWLSVFPVREMIKRGWIEESEPSLLELQMLRFFGKSRLEEVPFIGSGAIAPAAKKADYESTTAVQYVWLHRVKKIAENLECARFSPEKLKAYLPKIRAHMLDKEDLIHIPRLLGECGVRFVLVEALAGSKIDGVCVWIDGQPAIGMSMRLDRHDNFCFVLRHECEHALRGHGQAATFTPVDEFDYDTTLTEGLPHDEVVANEAAAEFLVPKRHLDSLFARKGEFISERDVLALASRLEVNPAIVVGQIQKRRERYGWLRKYQVSVKSALMEWEYKDGWDFQAPTGL